LVAIFTTEIVKQRSIINVCAIFAKKVWKKIRKREKNYLQQAQLLLCFFMTFFPFFFTAFFLVAIFTTGE